MFRCVSLCIDHTTCQYVVMVPLCRSATCQLWRAVSYWESVFCSVGGPVLRWTLWVGDLSGSLPTAVPSPVFLLGVGPLERDVGTERFDGPGRDRSQLLCFLKTDFYLQNELTVVEEAVHRNTRTPRNNKKATSHTTSYQES